MEQLYMLVDLDTGKVLDFTSPCSLEGVTEQYTNHIRMCMEQTLHQDFSAGHIRRTMKAEEVDSYEVYVDENDIFSTRFGIVPTTLEEFANAIS